MKNVINQQLESVCNRIKNFPFVENDIQLYDEVQNLELKSLYYDLAIKVENSVEFLVDFRLRKFVTAEVNRLLSKDEA